MDAPEPSEAPWPILPLFGLAGLATVVGGFFMLFAGPKTTHVQSEAAAPTAVIQPPAGQTPAGQAPPASETQPAPAQQPAQPQPTSPSPS